MTGGAEIRDAASVILVRERNTAEGLEVFLLRRHKRSGFMASSFVFPGGVAEPSDSNPRNTAARELFEEAGVLLATGAVDDAAAIRARAVGGEDANALLAAQKARFDVAAFHYFAHWITPSVERRRYSARFFVAAMPGDQEPRFDNVETVDQIWVTPDEGLARARDLRLPPPQVRTLMDMRESAVAGLDALLADCRARADVAAPILPRMAPSEGGGFSLLLPWDPEYAERGTGDAHPLDAEHPLAVGPSRFVLEDQTWKNVDAPGSTKAE